MKPVSVGNAENEKGWWRSWAEPFEPAPGAHGFLSKEFPEPAFNRAIFTVPPDEPEKTVARVVGKFKAFGTKPSLFVPEGPGFEALAEAAGKAGLRRVDRFLVMELIRPDLDRDAATSVQLVGHREAEAWSLAYLEAFYGDDALLEPVVHSVRRAASKRENRLLLARRGGDPAGTMALHLGGGYVGLYCLGTVPAMRGKGVAGTLIYHAQELASKWKTRVILQTFEGDGVEGFYLQRGFHRALSQDVFSAG